MRYDRMLWGGHNSPGTEGELKTEANQTQSRISDERLDWVADHPHALDVLPGEASDIARELRQARRDLATYRNAPCPFEQENEALRASHKRLVELLTPICAVAQNAPRDGCTIVLRFLPKTIKQWETALAEARKLEGK